MVDSSLPHAKEREYYVGKENRQFEKTGGEHQ